MQTSISMEKGEEKNHTQFFKKLNYTVNGSRLQGEELFGVVSLEPF